MVPPWRRRALWAVARASAAPGSAAVTACFVVFPVRDDSQQAAIPCRCYDRTGSIRTASGADRDDLRPVCPGAWWLARRLEPDPVAGRARRRRARRTLVDLAAEASRTARRRADRRRRRVLPDADVT